MESKPSHRQTEQTIRIVSFPLPIRKASFPIGKRSKLSKTNGVYSINGKIKCPLFGEEESLDREEKIKRKT